MGETEHDEYIKTSLNKMILKVEDKFWNSPFTHERAGAISIKGIEKLAKGILEGDPIKTVIQLI